MTSLLSSCWKTLNGPEPEYTRVHENVFIPTLVWCHACRATTFSIAIYISSRLLVLSTLGNQILCMLQLYSLRHGIVPT